MKIPSTTAKARQTRIVLTLAMIAGCMPGPAAMNADRPHVQLAGLPESPTENLERLAALTAERRAQRHGDEYRLGEGDLLSVSAVGVDSMTQKVRVAADGSVALPLLGAVTVADKTVAEAQRDLTTRLGQFMFEPHVNLFIDEYHSHQVAVVGAVQRPGVVQLPMASPTVLDALSAAGGATAEAGGRVYVVPAKLKAEREGDPPATLSSASAAISADRLPIVLEIKELGQAVENAVFQLPVRGGDVVMVPAAGEFIVSGWVAKPGKYPLKSTMTLRGAIATGGDLEFAADTAHVRIHRLSANGDTRTLVVDYRLVASGQKTDVFIHDGDVIEVGSSPIKIVPYAFYRIVTDIIRFGAGVRVPL